MDQGEKTEEPTAKRQEKAREDGNIATSRDIGGVSIFVAVAGIFIAYGGDYAAQASELFVELTRLAATAPEASSATLIYHATEAGSKAAAVLFGSIGAAAAAVGLGVGLAQTGGNWTSKAFGFKWEKVSFIKGLQRTLFSMQAAHQIGLALAKALLLGSALALVLRSALPSLIDLSRYPLSVAMTALASIVLEVLLVALLGSAVLAGVDYALSRRRVHNQMKMTKQEVKDEHKQQEGDPEVKGRLRQRMREIGRNQMLAATRKADVVVVNPTHYAVALSYEFGSTGAPKLLAKGKDAVAAKIREVARKHQIPIVANPPVARAIHAHCKVGQEVPPQMYEMVARVIAFLYRLRDRRAAA